MTKDNSFDDILPPSNTSDTRTPEPLNTVEPSVPRTPISIREIGLDSSAREERRKKHAQRRFLDVPETKKSGLNKGLMGTIGWWALGLIALACVGVVASFLLMAKSTVIVTPLEEHVTQSGNIVYTAYTEPKGDELGFAIIEESASKGVDLEASQTAHVERYASGTITVYNNYSENSQNFIKNTRFETADGKIYRVRNSIVIPGKSGSTPGSIDVLVYADKPGDEYNIANARFTVPGLKDGAADMYNAFYAETKGSLSGGFVGEEPAVDDATREAAIRSLKEDLTAALAANLKNNVPEDSLLLDDFIFVAPDEEPLTSVVDGKLHIEQRAVGRAVVFNESSLARAIGTLALATLADGTLEIPDLSSAEFTRIKRDENPWEMGVVQFTVTGQLTLRWVIDTESIARDLAGKPSASLDSIMTDYPGARRARAIIRPFWQTTFPDETGRISIKIVTSEEAE